MSLGEPLRTKRTAPWRKTEARKRPVVPGRHPKAKKGVTIEEIEGALWASGAMLADAARMLGISRSTLDARVKRSERLTALVKEIREDLTDFCESALIQQIMKKNLGAICFYLRTQGRARGYVEKQELETTTGEPIHFYIPKKAPIPEDEPLATIPASPGAPPAPEPAPTEASPSTEG